MDVLEDDDAGDDDPGGGGAGIAIPEDVPAEPGFLCASLTDLRNY